MTISFPVHTVVTLIGPSESGKSTFANRIKEQYPTQVRIIGSDDLRRELLGEDLDKYDPRMIYASEQAFDLLFATLRNAISYPVNAELVIVDTTGLDESFREKVRSLAKNHGYSNAAIVFDYKDAAEYSSQREDSDQIIPRQLSRMRRGMREIMSREYDAGITKLRSREEAAAAAFEIEGLDVLERRSVSGTPFIIGDIHSCYDELIELLEKAGYAFAYSSDNTHTFVEVDGKRHPRTDPIVLVGDIIDKGPQLEQTIRFLHRARYQIKMVRGNHDWWVYRYLKGELKNVEQHKVFFDSCDKLANSFKLRHMFFDIVEEMQPFYYGTHWIATHAPVSTKYLGKLSDKAEQRQTNWRYPRQHEYATPEEYETAFIKEMQFIKKEAVFNHPYHVFGHVAFPKAVWTKNKIGIDSNCVDGGELTGIFINDFRSHFFVSVKSRQTPSEKKLINPFMERRREKASWSDLDHREKGRVKHMAREKTNYVAPTMSPAPSVKSDNGGWDIESLDWALDHYATAGLDVVLQPKFMGSRCQVYLFQDPEKCYARSRGGFPIDDRVDLSKVYPELIERLQDSVLNKNVECVILDGELMPWSALGEGLIQHTFEPVYTGLSREHAFCKETGFYDKLAETAAQPEFRRFKQDWGNLDKEALKKKYGNRDYGIFSNLLVYLPRHKNPEHIEAGLNDFRAQLDVHGRPIDESEIGYEPFAILKIVYTDGTEKHMDDAKNSEMFNLVNPEAVFISGNPTDTGFREKAHAFFDTIRSKGLEGVVVKPNPVTVPDGTTPYLKVRTPEYLTLVYGPDYQDPGRYGQLCENKRIRTKQRLSIEEFKLGRRLLEIPYTEIAPDNEKYRELIAAFIGEEKRERSLDPRL